MQFTGNQMRNELKFITEALALRERFIEGSDPTMAVGKAIEVIGLKLSSLQQLYNDDASDRNQMVDQAKSLLTDISSVAAECLDLLAGGDPEDNNRSI